MLTYNEGADECSGQLQLVTGRSSCMANYINSNSTMCTGEGKGTEKKLVRHRPHNVTSVRRWQMLQHARVTCSD